MAMFLESLLQQIKKKSIDIYLGIGGGPEGVLAAAALSCLGCQMQTRLVFQDKSQESKARKIGIADLNKKYYVEKSQRASQIQYFASEIHWICWIRGLKKTQQ